MAYAPDRWFMLRDRLTARRCRAQLLSGAPAKSVVAAVGRLLAVQAQDPRGFRLAVRARTSGANARRLAQCGVTPAAAARGVRVVVRSLRDDGPLSRDEVRSRLVAADVPAAGQALVHILFQASLDGLIVHGPVISGRHCFVLVDDWLGPGTAVERDLALAELARRYLVGHGPATDRDLAAWSGLGLGDVRRGLQSIAAEVVELPGGLVDLAPRREESELPPPLLLGSFDPLLHGWKDRTAILGSNPTVVTTNGIFRPILLVGGRAVATWRLSGGILRLLPFEAVSGAALVAAGDEALAIGRYLGLGPITMEVTQGGTYA